MVLLVLLLIAGIFIFFSERQASERRNKDLNNQIGLLRQYGLDFIKGYDAVVKTKSEKALLKRMETDYRAWHGLPDWSTPAAQTQQADVQAQTAPQAHAYATSVAPTTYSQSQATYVPPKHSDVQHDNATLLLYFGAFLFVASAGLFVTFGDAPGGLKTFIVLLVTVIMYGCGVWLHANRPKLSQAGQAFSGIGVVLAPLVGVALYTYIFNQDQGNVVWLLTSLFCMGLYVHALRIFKTTLMGYVLVFTFLSLFESGIGMFDVPVYYYGWGLAFAGLLLQLGSRYGKWSPELYEPAYQGAQIFLPLSLLVAVSGVPSLGATQLGVSLLLAAAFYGLETLRTVGANQETNAIAAQASFIAASGALAYGLSEKWQATILIVLAVVGGQLAVLLTRKKAESRLWLNYASVLLAAAVIDSFVAIGTPKALLVTLGTTAVIGVAIWLKQLRADGYVVGGIALLALPYVYGQLVSDNFTALQQVEAGFVALFMLLAVYLLGWQRSQNISQWKQGTASVYGMGVFAVLVASLYGSPYLCLSAALVAAASMILLAEHDKQRQWAEFAGLVLVVPMLRSIGDDHPFLLTVEIGLLLLVVLTLRYRSELLRWVSTAVWLVVPYALAHGGVGSHWAPEGYAWAYVVAMIVLIISRAIARGAILPANNVLIASLTRQASQSYVVGYIIAAAIALMCSLLADDSQIHTTAILAVLVVVVLLLGRYIEKRQDIMLLLPFMVQATLLSALRPPASGTLLDVYLVASTALAVTIYAEALARADKNPVLRIVVQSALISAFVTPAAIIFADLTWAMPLGLFVAGGLALHYSQSSTQANREAAFSVMTAAIGWLMLYAGVEEFQAYVHLVVATLALFAYWRFKHGQANVSNQYIWWALGTATVPLALQALGASSGGAYGWWLLLEQVAIMLIGMAIQRRFVTMWGLYVAVGAVLYQLRDLGYAALAVLALFLIGLAVYRLQKDVKK